MWSDGQPIWRWQSGSPEQDGCWGLAVDPQDAIWVGAGSADEIAITRVAP